MRRETSEVRHEKPVDKNSLSLDRLFCFYLPIEPVGNFRTMSDSGFTFSVCHVPSSHLALCDFFHHSRIEQGGCVAKVVAFAFGNLP